MLEPEINPSDASTSTPRRSVRRRLVQSTLFPLKPPPPPPPPNDNDADDKEDEHDEDYCLTEKNHKKRKSKSAKITPPKKSSKKQNVSPKKNAPTNGVKDSAQVVTRIPDLRLEARISAEESSRLYAGKEIHPLFAPRKVGKKVQDVSESGSNFCTANRNVGRITCGPIHVFENIQDDNASLDWKNWTFLEKTTYVNCVRESSSSSVLEGSVESLNFDKLRNPLDPSIAPDSHIVLPASDQPFIQKENLQETSPSNSTLLVNEQTLCPQMCKDAEVHMEVDRSTLFSGQAEVFRNSDAEPTSRFLDESMRSYYHSGEGKAKGCLWTYKYKPTKAIEVCGNGESVNFLRDWLHQWHERRYQSRKEFSNIDKSVIQDDDDDYICSHSDYDSEDINDEDPLQNVVLITGPIGSGKSAAVYACAEEQGFEILELNASDYRNGTTVKQYFGDTLGSHGFKRLLEHTVSSQKKTTKSSPSLAMLNSKAADNMDGGVVELITVSDDEDHGPDGTSQKLLGKNNIFACDRVQTLILVEEIDILFPDDRGCIAAIQQIAETARGPIILTSNSDNHGLPDNFDRLHVSFSLPSPKELLCHLYTVCVTEGVNVHPHLLEKFIQSCDGDIRKTIMHLQFWFQSKGFGKDGKVQTIYGPLPFDLEVGHQILPKLMPWDFPSELSEKIEKEVTESVTIMEESSSLQGLVEEEIHIHEQLNDLDEQHMEIDYIEAKKMEMIKRNGSVPDYSEFEIQYNSVSELSCCSGSPISSRQNGRRKLVVMSSDSEDEDPNNGHPFDIHDKANKRQSLQDNGEPPSEFQFNENESRISVRRMVCSEFEDSDKENFKYSETTDDTCLDETCKSVDISCVPESTFVPETVIENEIETISAAVSSGHLGASLEVSVNNELIPSTFSTRKRLRKMKRNSDFLVNSEILGSSPKDDVQYFLDDKMETKIVNVMDECSRADFKLKSKFVESCPPMETDIVQKLWRQLRDCRTDLRLHATSERLDAFQVVKLASGLSNLISDAELFHNHQQNLYDVMESQMFLSDEASSSWHDEQIMMSTFAEHGFCFYAKKIADLGLKLGRENKIDLTFEMLASTTNIMALGKLSRQDLTNDYTEKNLEVNNTINHIQKSENKTSLSNVIQSIVPARISLSMKDVAFTEYLSSLRQISRSEASRISESVEKKRRGRVRGFQHYLSRCTMLSPEDISFMSEGDLYKKVSSQCQTKVESNYE